MIKVINIAFSDSRGGAAIACKRAHESLSGTAESYVLTPDKKLVNLYVRFRGEEYGFLHFTLMLIEHFFVKLMYTQPENKVSLNILGLFSSKNILKYDSDVVHFHWINNCTISLREMSKLRKPFIVTMHDEWWYLNGEHYRDIKKKRKCDLKKVFAFPMRWLYEMYRKRYISKIIDKGVFVAPSLWVKQEAEKFNPKFSGNILVIPNPIDVKIFKQRERCLSLKMFDIPKNKKIILFGAQKGGSDFIKGRDIAFNAIDEFSKRHDGGEYAVLIFGGRAKKRYFRNKVEVIEVGFVCAAEDMSFLYSCSDVTLVTSRLEAFGQVALESIACHTPVIGFRNTGVEDIIEHGKTGFLCSPFLYTDVAYYLELLFSLNEIEKTKMGDRCRHTAEVKFSQKIVSSKLNELYQNTLKGAE